MPDEQGTRAETAYTVTVTAFYVLAIAANIWILWQTYGDSPEGQLARKRMEKVWKQAIRPLRERKHFRRAAAQVQFEAYSTVVDADPTWAGGEDADG
jgi:hypothetical protein